MLALVAPALALAVASPAGCNVFASLDRCTSDSDCPSGATCDSEGKFCLRADGSVQDAPIDSPADATDAADAAETAPPKCTGVFGAPALVRGLEDVEVFSARLTTSELQVLFSANNVTSPDISSASRSTTSEPFSTTKLLSELNTTGTSEYWPTISDDQHTVFFESDRSLEKDAGVYELDRARIWQATSSTLVLTFGEPFVQPFFHTDTGAEGAPYLHPNGDSLYFFSTNRDAGNGDEDLFVATNLTSPLSVTIKSLGSGVNGVNTPANAENAPVVSLDERTLFFARGDTITTKRDIWMATRATTAVDFGNATLVAELDTPGEDFPTWLSADDCRLYFVSDRATDADAGADASTAGVLHLWMSSRPAP